MKTFKKFLGYIVVFLVSGVFWLGLVWIGLSQAGLCDTRTASDTDGEAAVETLRVSISSEKQQAFFRAVHDFAIENEFAVRTGQFGPGPDIGIVEGWQHDVNFIAVESSDAGRYNVSFFRVCNAPVPSAYIRRLADHLEKKLADLPDAEIERRP